MSDTGKHFGMKYMDRIDAHIDEGMYDLIEFFLDRGYQTEFCCSKTFNDHFTESEQEAFESRDPSDHPDPHTVEVSSPYISFQSMFHTHHEDKTTVDKTVYSLKEALSNNTRLSIYSQGTPHKQNINIDADQKIRYNFDIGSPYQENPAADHTYTFRINELDLQRCFMNINRDTQLYDTILESVFKIVQLAVDEPILGHNASLYLNADTHEITTQITVRDLPDTIDESTLNIVANTDVETPDLELVKETVPTYDIYGDISVLRRELREKPDQDYIDSLYQEKELVIDPFEHPTQPE